MTFVSTVMSLLLCTVAAIPPLQKPQSDSYSVQMHSVTVTSWDGTRLNARAAVPSTSNSSLRFPCVLMSNSWGIPDVQYANVQESWASQGYVVFEYEARGWYTSEGTVSLGNITDQKDVSAILDYLTQQASEWHIDTRAFASCGVSYGAGLAVLGAAHDSRIVTALSLSGWGNLSRAFDSAFGPNRIWANLLIGSGEATARLPPTLQEMWDRLNDNTQLDVVRTWANLRSASAPDLLSQLAARRVPIFISNNFEDQLFTHAADPFDYRQALHAAGLPTYLLLNQGIHASAEVPGMVFPGSPGLVWERARQWLDWHLKGQASPIATAPPIEIEVRRPSLFSRNKYLTFGSWPPTTNALVSTRYTLSGRGDGREGGLTRIAGASGEVAKATPPSDTISFSYTSGLSAGVPLASSVFQVELEVPIVAVFGLVNTKHATLYTSEPLAAPMQLCGVPNVTAQVTSSLDSFQLIAYLYDVNFLGIGTLISHGPRNVWRTGVPGQATQLDIVMRGLCVEIPKGHRIGLGLDMWSALYTPASDDSSLTLMIDYDGKSVLELPIVTDGAATLGHQSDA